MKRLAILWVVIALIAAVPDGTRTAEIAAALKSRVEAKKATGMVVATIEPDGSQSIAAYGSPGPGALPLDADTVFEIGSITKVFTAILLAEMADRGEVRLDDPVAKHLPPDVRVPERAGKKITLLDLTTQVSGLPRMPGNFTPKDLANPYADYTAQQMFEFLGRYELPRDIGAQFEYSNLGVGLLGQALTHRAGKPYDALVQERILKPLKMDHSGIALTPWMRAHLAKGHNAQGSVTSNWDIPAFAGAGALRSTMNDMLIFARANLGILAAAPGSLEIRRLQRLMEQTHRRQSSVGRPDTSIGMGWVLQTVNDREVVWHNGGTGGYRTWLGLDKTRKVAAIVLTNSSLSNDDLGLQLLTGGLRSPDPPTRSLAGAPNPAPFAWLVR
jgi:CubicO group peptidase (beta-lactamase class C family)